MHSVYLLRDNQTVAGEQDIVRDHDLVKRTHSQGILFPDTWWQPQGHCAIYFYEGPVTGERGRDIGTTMNMVLRPGEALVWRWGRTSPVKFHGSPGTMPTYPALIYNGLWEYRPDFSKELWRKGVVSVENIKSGPDGLTAVEGRQGTVIWNMCSPYVFVGGRLESEGSAQFFISFDGQTWQPVKEDLDKSFWSVSPARYQYQLKCRLEGAARLRRLAILNDVQMAPLAMPEMGVGENTFTYSDQSTGVRHVKITHEWVERSAFRPPSAPQAPLYPPDGGESDGTDVVFRWTAAESVDGLIGDYQFELSSRPDMRFPLSMSFYKLISRTADVTKTKQEEGKETIRIKAQYTLPQPGLLTPDCPYYWRVRAMNSHGVWGPWSQTWSFTPRGLAYPLNVTVEFNSAQDLGVLRWQANPLGRRSVKYLIYGSDEKGFTVADRPFQSDVGVTKKEMAGWNPWFPANFIAEIQDTELTVLGPGVNLPAANKTYYRVVAVDAHGKRSGPSDFAECPRPVIYTQPIVTAKVGAEYRYQPRANRSLGDLTARMQGDNQVSGYFDIENPVFSLEQSPVWMKLDEKTGTLSGVPPEAGQVEVTITATISREVRQLDEKTLAWGNEKVLSTETKHIGMSRQSFVIKVQP